MDNHCILIGNPRRGRTGAAQEKKRSDNADVRRMRILLQHGRTGLYLRGLGDWTANVHEAFDFQHSQRAIDFARQHALSGVQIAVRFMDCDFDEIAPLPPLTEAAQPSLRF